MLNDWLLRHDLEVSYPNLKRAYEELTESAMLHQTTPDPRPVGGINPHIQQKPKAGQYTGSHYDRTQIARFKREIALMNAQQIRECLQANGWDDWPAWLKAGS